MIRVGHACLVGDAVGQIRLCEALLLQIATIDAAREGHGLEAEAADAIDVINGEPHHVAELMVVHALDDGGHKDNLQAHRAAILNAGQLGFHQALAAGAEIDVVREAVELQVESVQTRFLGGRGKLRTGETDSVGGCLDVREAEFGGRAQHVQETRVHGGLTAGELHHAVGHGTLRAQALQHVAHLLERRLVEIPGRVGVGKANRAGQVAAIGQVDVGENRVRRMQRAEATVVRASRCVQDGRVLQATIVAEFPLFHLEVKAGVGVDLVAEVAVRQAGFLHVNGAVLLEKPRLNHLQAFGADGLRRLGQALLERLDARAGKSGFGLDDLKIAPAARLGGRSYGQSGHDPS